MISYFALGYNSRPQWRELFSLSVSLVGPIGVNILTIDYLVSSYFVVVSGSLLEALRILVRLLSSCECFLVSAVSLLGLPDLVSVDVSFANYGPLNCDGALLSC